MLKIEALARSCSKLLRLIRAQVTLLAALLTFGQLFLKLVSKCLTFFTFTLTICLKKLVLTKDGLLSLSVT